MILNDGGKVSTDAGRVLDPGAPSCSRAATIAPGSILQPGASAAVYLKIPYVPDAKRLLRHPSQADFDAAHQRVQAFWTGMLAKAAHIEVPEPRLQNVWRALLLQNFVLADGPRFTYGSGLMYNDSTYPQENGFATHTFAMYGFPDYADALQPWFVEHERHPRRRRPQISEPPRHGAAPPAGELAPDAEDRPCTSGFTTTTTAWPTRSSPTGTAP